MSGGTGSLSVASQGLSRLFLKTFAVLFSWRDWPPLGIRECYSTRINIFVSCSIFLSWRRPLRNSPSCPHYKNADGILHSSFRYNVSRDISIVMICWHYGPAGFPQSSLSSAIRYTMEALSFVENWYPPFLHRSPLFPVAFDRKSEGGRGDEKWSNILKGVQDMVSGDWSLQQTGTAQVVGL